MDTDYGDERARDAQRTRARNEAAKDKFLDRDDRDDRIHQRFDRQDREREEQR